ncbi:hypothetical protein [Lentzea sp. NBRC 102530]|uniref:hypothetical protein n=1 Tax=Lentzea sp. NBRC 102530 TaxID=3032201 RepID=UPI0024A23C1C|nr:hypothetical protein [Lentzea sp. NBRC 102530]GLY50384.1 hypothetical protein Lesp01_40400 [Lentzea sp. NBRC 102530]
MVRWQYAHLVQLREWRLVYEAPADPAQWQHTGTREEKAEVALGTDACQGTNRVGRDVRGDTATVTTELHELCCPSCQADPSNRKALPPTPRTSGFGLLGRSAPVPPELPPPVQHLFRPARPDPTAMAEYTLQYAEYERSRQRFERAEQRSQRSSADWEEARAHERCCSWAPTDTKRKRVVAVRRETFQDMSSMMWTVTTSLTGPDGTKTELQPVLTQPPADNEQNRVALGDRFVPAKGLTVADLATEIVHRELNVLGDDGWELFDQQVRNGIFGPEAGAADSSDWIQRTFWLRRQI